MCPNKIIIKQKRANFPNQPPITRKKNKSISIPLKIFALLSFFGGAHSSFAEESKLVPPDGYKILSLPEQSGLLPIAVPANRALELQAKINTLTFSTNADILELAGGIMHSDGVSTDKPFNRSIQHIQLVKTGGKIRHPNQSQFKNQSINISDPPEYAYLVQLSDKRATILKPNANLDEKMRAEYVSIFARVLKNNTLFLAGKLPDKLEDLPLVVPIDLDANRLSIAIKVPNYVSKSKQSRKNLTIDVPVQLFESVHFDDNTAHTTDIYGLMSLSYNASLNKRGASRNHLTRVNAIQNRIISLFEQHRLAVPKMSDVLIKIVNGPIPESVREKFYGLPKTPVAYTKAIYERPPNSIHPNASRSTNGDDCRPLTRLPGNGAEHHHEMFRSVYESYHAPIKPFYSISNE